MRENKPRNGKRSLISIVLSIVILIIGGIYAYRNYQVSLLNEEINTINTSGKVNSEIKSSGKYGEVEKALKDYVREYQAVAKKASDTVNNGELLNILSIDNIKKDGPEFVESKKLLVALREQCDEVKTKLPEMITNEYKEKKATESGLSGKYKDLFISNIQLDGELQTVNKSIDKINNYFGKIEEVLNFLTEHKDSWNTSDTNVQFTNMSLVTQYNSLISSLNIAAKF